jgi:hypothetical protein
MVSIGLRIREYSPALEMRFALPRARPALTLLAMDRDSYAIIKDRSSVRSFAPQPLDPLVVERLRALCAAPVPAPFGTQMRFDILALSEVSPEIREKLGTYGVIKGAELYLAGCLSKGTERVEDYGYVFEDLVLEAWGMGLGSCWLGGTLNRDGFMKALKAGPEEFIPTVSPLGIAADKRRLVERVMRRGVGADDRLPCERLFFEEDGSALSREAAGPYADCLEAARWSPSASNKQPTRVVRTTRGFEFRLARTPGYGQALSFDVQRMDVGIAMRHFDRVAQDRGLGGRWKPGDLEPRLDGTFLVAVWA